MGFRSVVKKLIPRSLFKSIEPFGHLVEAIFFNVIYGFPARGLKVIGVTGTNGKTSTCFLIHNMLKGAGHNVGLMTTVAYGVNNDVKPQIAHMTTVSVPILLKRIKAMKKQGMQWLVLEVTSHALAQHRVWGIPFDIAVMTNITHEHLDYHGTFENYVIAKRKLFEICNRSSGLKVGVINADDPSVSLLVNDIENPVTYGMDEGDLRARSVRLTPAGSRYIVKVGDQEYYIHCQLPGSFNVYNSLAAVAVGRELGLTPKQIEQGIETLKGVEGRMTRIDEGQNFDVIVDFAHTPDSFEKIFRDLKPTVKGKLIVMFGSAGRRDEAKRPIMGELAGKYADEVILTEEDDRDVNGLDIIDQIASGALRAGKTKDNDLFVVHNRVKAIEFTLKQAKKDDTVLLLGKGHEKTIARAHGDDPWDEIGTTMQTLKKLHP